MTLLLAAVGATVTAIVELTVGPYLRVGDAQPHLVLVLAVIWTVAVGLEAVSLGLRRGPRPRCPGTAAARIDRLRSAARASAAPASIARLFPRLRPIVAIIATAAPEPRLLDDPRPCSSARSAPRIPVADPAPDRAPGAVYDAVARRARSVRSSVSIHDRRVDRGAGRTGEHLPRRPPDRPLAALAVPRLRPRRGPRRSAGSRRGCSTCRSSSGGQFAALSARAIGPSSGDPVAARPDLRPSRSALVTNVADVRGQDPAGRPPEERRDEVVDGWPPSSTWTSADINAAIDGNPVSLRPRPDRLGRPRCDGPPDLGGRRSSCPGVEVVVEARRQYTDGPARVPAPRLHRARLGRAARRPQAAGLPAGRPARQDRRSRRTTRRSCAATYGSETVERDASGREDPGPRDGPRGRRPATRSTLTIDTKEQKYAQKALKWA